MVGLDGLPQDRMTRQMLEAALKVDLGTDIELEDHRAG
jgi:hypothetical protein